MLRCSPAFSVLFPLFSRRCLSVVPLLLLLFSSLSHAAGLTVYGPETFYRSKGTPLQYNASFTIDYPSTEYVMKIYNGGINHDYENVPSAVIRLNGQDAVTPDQFGTKIDYIEAPVTLLANNQLDVDMLEIRGKPNGAFTIEIVQGPNFNYPPEILSLPITSVDENALYQYDVVAQDLDVDAVLTYSLTARPSGMTIDPNTGRILWTPGSAQIGDHPIQVVVTDNKGESAVQDFTLTVKDVPSPPIIVTPSLPAALEDSPYSATIEATDSDGDVITFSLEVGHPSGMSIDPSSGVISWLPTNSEVGSPSVTVRATDTTGLFATQPYTIAVQNVNDTPTLAPIANTVIDQGAIYQYAVQASDVDAGDSLSYSLSLVPAPSTSATIDSTGLIQWTPTNGDVGSYTVTVTVADLATASAQQSFTLTVNNVNDAPVIAPIPNQSTDEDGLYQYAVQASDVDVGDALSYSLAMSPTPTNPATIDSTGLIQWMPANEDVGSYTITVTVTDGAVNAQQAYTLTINNTNDAPTIDSTPVTTATQDQPYLYQVLANDVDSGDTLSYSLTVAPAGMTIDSTGLINWTPTNAQVGDQSVTVVVTDVPGESVPQSFTIHVIDVNDPPQFISTPTVNALQGQLYTYTALATDDGGEIGITYTLDKAPAGMTMDGTGHITWTPSNAQVALQTIILRATDTEGLYATQMFYVVVEDTNEAPMVTSSPLTSVAQDQDYRYDVIASDPDSWDTLTYSLDNAPVGMHIDANNGTLLWTPDGSQVGQHDVIVRVKDQRGLFTTQSYTLTVTDHNDAPQITSQALTQATQGEIYHYQVAAMDHDTADILTYSLLRGPQGMTIDPTTGQIDWPVEEQYVGDIVAQGACYKDRPDSSAFKPLVKWTVNNPTIGPPVIGPLVDTNGDGKTDQNDATMVAALRGSDTNPRLAVIDGATGQLIWQNNDEPLAVISIGFADVDGDGMTEIFALGEDDSVIAFNGHDGTVKWRAAVPWLYNPSGKKSSSFSFADLDKDGLAEIFFAGAVLNHDGTIRWQSLETGTAMLPADVNLDGYYEVIFGSNIYDRFGSLVTALPNSYINGAGTLTLGGLDEDPYPELIYKGYQWVFVFEHDGTLKWTHYDGNNNYSNSPPTIADFDGDGQPEIGVLAKNRMYTLDAQGNVEISRNVNFNDSSAFVGTTAFDFLGDGSAELIANDHSYIHILYGDQPIPLYEWSNGSYTQHEYVVVADIDNDGHAEMVAYSGDSWIAYEDRNDRWPATRGIWNQYHYYPASINDDGSVPTQPVSAWNNQSIFRSNPAYLSSRKPDLQIAGAQLSTSASQQVVYVNIINTGEVALNALTSIDVYQGSSATLTNLIGSIQLENLDAGESIQLAIPSNADLSLTHELFIAIDEAGQVEECNDQNNHHILPIVEVKVSDPAGASDHQIYSISTARRNHAPQIVSEPTLVTPLSRAYQYIVEVDDIDADDRHHFTLLTAPSFMRIDEQGVVRGYPQAGVDAEGNYDVVIEVCDRSDACVQKSYTLTVGAVPPNQSPVFDEYPPQATIEIGQLYTYTLQASDPDGDLLFIDLTKRPNGMQHDPITHTISWIPGPEDVGVNTYNALVMDPYGYQGSVSGMITVVDPVLVNNHYPKIVSSIIPKAYVGELYTNKVIATDEDGDNLTLSLGYAPAGMEVVGDTLYWTPDATQIGSNPIAVYVQDEHGAQVGQSTGITVDELPPANTAPVIESTPAAQALAGQLYTYTVVASDADNDPLIYQLINPSSANMSFDAATQTFSWLPTENEVNTYQSFYLNASDGKGGSSTQSVSVFVASANQPPAIQSTPNFDAIVGELYQYQVVATDPDNDLLSYTLLSAASGVTLDQNGLLSWTPDETQIGEYLMEVRVTDTAGHTVKQVFTVQSATYQSQLPQLSSLPPLVVEVNQLYQYPLAVTNPRSTSLGLALTTAPAAMTLDPQTGLLQWLPTEADLGQHPVSIEISNAVGTITQDYLLTVREPNVAPRITSSPTTLAVVDQSYTYQVIAEDANNDLLNYRLIEGPANMTIDPISGEITWLPTLSQATPQPITLWVEDGIDYAEQHYALAVSADPVPLDVFLQLDTPRINLGESTTVTVTTTGGSGTVSTYLMMNGNFVTLDAYGQAEIIGEQMGTYTLSAFAVDDQESIEETALLSVRDPNDNEVPIVTLLSPADAETITNTVAITGTVSDTNLAEYQVYLSPAGHQQWQTLAQTV